MWNSVSREIHLRTLLYFDGIRIFPLESKAPHSFSIVGPTKCNCACSGTRGVNRESWGGWFAVLRPLMTVTICDTLGYSGKCSPQSFLWTCSVRIFHVSRVFQACTGSGNWNKHFFYAVSFLFVSRNLVITWVILNGGTLTHWKWALCSSCPCLRLNDTGNRTAVWLAK